MKVGLNSKIKRAIDKRLNCFMASKKENFKLNLIQIEIKNTVSVLFLSHQFKDWTNLILPLKVIINRRNSKRSSDLTQRLKEQLTRG